MGWFGKSMLAAVLNIPAWLMVSYATKRGMRGEVTSLCFSLGCIVTLLIWVFTHRELAANLSASRTLAFVMIATGIIGGAVIQMLAYSAVNGAPNPGLPSTILTISAIGVFILSPLLAKKLPEYFTAARFDWVTMSGVALTVAGVAIIGLRK